MDASALHAAMGAMDFAIESLSGIIKTRARVEVEDRTIADVLDQLIAAQASLRTEYLAMRNESDLRRALLCPTCAAAYHDPPEPSAQP